MSLLLPIEIWQIIFNYSELKEQLTLYQLNKYFHQYLQIIDFYHIDRDYKLLLTNTIIMRYKDLKYLDVSHNSEITDQGIKFLNLIVFALRLLSFAVKAKQKETNANYNYNITNRGIKNMNLKKLSAVGWCGITDKGIKEKYSLEILDASYNKKITDNGIKNLKLHKLYACGNNKITDNGMVVTPPNT